MYQCDSIEHGYTVQFLVHTVGLVCVKLTDCLLHNYDGLYQCGSVGDGHTVQFSVHTVGLACAKPRNHPPPGGGAKLKHTVFSKLNAPGIYFKLDPMDPAFIRSRRLIGAWRLLMRCFFFCHGKLIYYHPTSKNQQSWSSRDNFSFVLCDKLSLGLLLVTHHTIQYAYYYMLQSRCVKKKSVNNTCSILRQGNTKF